jgi:hypothetical protein
MEDTMEYEIRDPFVGEIVVVGETLEEAIEREYGDIPVEERPAYIWFRGRKVRVPGGTCSPVQ